MFSFIANNLHNGDLGPTYNHGRSRSGAEDHSEPPRPPPPRPEGTNNTIIHFKSEEHVIPCYLYLKLACVLSSCFYNILISYRVLSGF